MDPGPITPQRPPKPPRSPKAKKRPIISLPVSLIFNLLLAVLLSLVMVRKGWTECPCVPTAVNVFFIALVVMFLLQLFWRYLGGAIKVGKGYVRNSLLRLSLDSIFAVLDDLHLARWRPWVLWTAAGGALTACLFGLGPLSPFRIGELPPVIEGFLVSRSGTAEILVNPGESIDVPLGDSFQIKAMIRPLSGIQCEWSAGHGDFSAVDGCTAIYVAPPDGAFDNLSIRVRSSCKTQDSIAGMAVRLTFIKERILP